MAGTLAMVDTLGSKSEPLKKCSMMVFTSLGSDIPVASYMHIYIIIYTVYNIYHISCTNMVYIYIPYINIII